VRNECLLIRQLQLQGLGQKLLECLLDFFSLLSGAFEAK